MWIYLNTLILFPVPDRPPFNLVNFYCTNNTLEDCVCGGKCPSLLFHVYSLIENKHTY